MAWLQAFYLGRVWLRRVGDEEEPDLVPVRALLRPGEAAIDGGANFGRYADAFAEAVGPNGSVVAIEPVPRSARMLQRVLSHRGRTQVTVVEAALGSEAGTGWMELPTSESGETNYFRAHLATDGHTHGPRVRVQTLDEVAEMIPEPPALIKLDLEGHERAALAGATSLLSTAHAAWIVEVNDDPDDPSSDGHAVERLLASRGYLPLVWNGTALELRGGSRRGPNVFFLLPHHIDRVRGAGLTVLDGEAKATSAGAPRDTT
jgi:FkbM family methyltransferase